MLVSRSLHHRILLVLTHRFAHRWHVSQLVSSRGVLILYLARRKCPNSSWLVNFLYSTVALYCPRVVALGPASLTKAAGFSSAGGVKEASASALPAGSFVTQFTLC